MYDLDKEAPSADKLKNYINVRERMSNIKHAFILSFFFLLLHQDYKKKSDEDSYYKKTLRLICQ